jgi:hypothetical protein
LFKFHQNGPLSFITETLSAISVDTTRLQQLLLAYYRILQANRELPRTLRWSLAPLSNLIYTPHLDNGVRLLAIRCYSLQSGMGEEERSNLEREILGEPCGVDCNLNYGQNVDGSVKEVDGWLLPVLEVRRVQEERESIVSEQLDFYSREGGNDTFLIEKKDLRFVPFLGPPTFADVFFFQPIGCQCARSFAPSLFPKPPSRVPPCTIGFIYSGIATHSLVHILTTSNSPDIRAICWESASSLTSCRLASPKPLKPNRHHSSCGYLTGSSSSSWFLCLLYGPSRNI